MILLRGGTGHRVWGRGELRVDDDGRIERLWMD